MSDWKDESGNSFNDDTENNLFEQIIQEKFDSFYLFHEVFLKPVCYRMNPLLALYPWKPQALSWFHE